MDRTWGKQHFCGFILLAIVVLGAFILAPNSFADEGSEKPYKASTVDECIQEKECVWYAFSRQLALDDYTRWVVNGKSLRKWDHFLGFRASSNGHARPSDYLPQLHEGIIKPLEKYLPDPLTVSGKYAIFFADDIQKTINDAVEDFNKIQIETQRTKSQYNKEHEGNEGCYTTIMIEKGHNAITRAVTFVDTKDKKAMYCTASHFYHALGLWGHLKDQPFSFLSDDKNQIELTELDKFLVFLLYQPEFKNGQKAQEIERVFNKIYDTTKDKFLTVSD